MIAEMITRVPGPKSKEIDQGRIIFSEKLEGTNVWDLDGNRYLDLTSGGGLLPFGYVDEGLVALSEVMDAVDGYGVRNFEDSLFEGKKMVFVGAGICSAFDPVDQLDFIALEELVHMTSIDADVLIVRAEYLDLLSLKRISSWCGQYRVQWVADERDYGLFRCGELFSSLSHQPDHIIIAAAAEGMERISILLSKGVEGDAIDDFKVAANYADRDIKRTIKLQSLELSELLIEMIEGKRVGCVGAYHYVEIENVDEVARICDGLLQRGIIVATMGTRIVLLPSLYLALGEIIFVVNHIKLVVADINEVELPWINDDLRG